MVHDCRSAYSILASYPGLTCKNEACMVTQLYNSRVSHNQASVHTECI